MIQVYQNQLSPYVSDTIKVSGTAFNLTGTTVRFRMRPVDGTTLKVDALATIISPATNGQVRYTWTGTDTDTVGEYMGWWSVTLTSGAVQDTPEFPVVVLVHAPSAAAALCTLADIHAVLRITTASDPRDEIIQKYILQATKQILQHTNREFVPQTTATRRFGVNVRSGRNRVDFTPYDLQSVTSVVLHPEGTGVTLDNTNYELRPLVTDEPVYTSMLLSPWQSMVSTRQLKFGKPFVDINGVWGWPSVPEDVKRSCEITVQSWLRRDTTALGGAAAAAMGHGTSEGAPVAQAAFFLPYAAQQLLSQYERSVGAF